MRVLLRFNGESKVTRMAHPEVIPRKEELFETGTEVWKVESVSHTLDHPDHEVAISLRRISSAGER